MCGYNSQKGPVFQHCHSREVYIYAHVCTQACMLHTLANSFSLPMLASSSLHCSAHLALLRLYLCLLFLATTTAHTTTITNNDTMRTTATPPATTGIRSKPPEEPAKHNQKTKCVIVNSHKCTNTHIYKHTHILSSVGADCVLSASVAGGPLPILLVATTEQLYSVSAESPVTV